ncbi:MAG TPA: ZIP family metal transporter [Oscillospiraceae bacterium]|nr:ZIP family metal transporter [Oscillospiraceae bacterium]HNW05276.1 ZIP family metal transporter [Oscillospiraceae bacterium]HPW00298.1 ZIP family metal transporter [Oscillospiraceae bacterium]
MQPALLALIGTGGTFLLTALGAAEVYLFGKDLDERIQSMFFGFAAGVMTAASIWSMLLPSIDEGGWVPACVGFLCGGAFILLLDRLVPHLHALLSKREDAQNGLKRTTLITLAITLHNIPEGLAVGLAFAMATVPGSSATMAGATALAVGIGLQNIPEGTAVSLPMFREGCSKNRAFLIGAASGAVEPIAGVAGALLAVSIVGIMPWILAFAAGAMIFVVAEELIPGAKIAEHVYSGSIGMMVGFAVMMVMDVALG